MHALALLSRKLRPLSLEANPTYRREEESRSIEAATKTMDY